MPIRYDIVHTTVYRYAQPVTFGEHRVMFRPRDSHDQRVLATDLDVSPNSDVRMIQDPMSNSVAIVQPLEPAETLQIVASFTIEHAKSMNLELPLAKSAEVFPFAYTLDERIDLEPFLRPNHDDDDGVLTAWASRSSAPTVHRNARLAGRMTSTSATIRLRQRDEEGTQTPGETLALGSGSCRDFALLMMEASRRLGIATRFVSGYLYDPALDSAGSSDGSGFVGAGYTHAWMQAYLPGAGWVPFDPTNTCLAHRLIASAWRGSEAARRFRELVRAERDYLGLDVSVTSNAE